MYFSWALYHSVKKDRMIHIYRNGQYYYYTNEEQLPSEIPFYHKVDYILTRSDESNHKANPSEKKIKWMATFNGVHI